MNEALRLAAAGLGLPLLLLTGCGMVAAPQPPSLKLPEPVVDLAAQRTGDQVVLHWAMPKRATDKVLLVGDQKAQVCRRVDAGSCEMAGTAMFAPEAAATFTDTLPAALASGPPRLLTYTVELLNHSGRSAGTSNPANTAAGVAPPPITGLRAQAQAEGIVLSWSPQGGEETIRIRRTLVQKTGIQKTASKESAQKSNMQESQLPLEQTLEFSGKDLGRVLDHDAVLDHTYNYIVQRVAKLTLQGQSIEVAGEPSASITIDARDVFPPAIPQGLQAVADPESHAIDLSWQPNVEPDLAGYTVYRRDAGASTLPVRISSPAQAAPSFRDNSAQPGQAYEYSVSAVDRDGNESRHSPDVEEALPQQ